MRSKSAVKWKSVWFLLCLGMSFVTGCADKNVDYHIEGTTGSTQTEITVVKRGLEQFSDASDWEEEWTAVNTKGNTVTLQADAKIRIPDTDQMSVVEVEEAVFDADYKERVVKSIFGAEEVFYNDITHLPRKELEKERELSQEAYDSCVESGDQEMSAEYETVLQTYDELLQTAKDTYIPVSRYDVDEYLGERDGITFELRFSERDFVWGRGSGGCRGRSIYLMPKDVYQVCPEEFHELEDLRFWGEVGAVHSFTPGNNQCEISKEEAQEQAQSFVDRLGLDYSIYTGSEDIFWKSGNDDSEDHANGYVFAWDIGIDGESFVLRGTQQSYNNFDKKKESEETQYDMDSRLEVFVTDMGIIEARIDNPLEIIGVSGKVGLLPLDTVEGIMKEQITQNFGEFRFKYTSERVVTFNEMELIYFRVMDKEKPGYYSYVPTWRLSNAMFWNEGLQYWNFFENPVLVNAIDGSMIDFYDEV